MLRGSPGASTQVVGPPAAATTPTRADGVGGAGFRIRDARQRWVDRVGVVDQREVLDAGGVELPVGDLPAVRAPPESIAQIELFFVDPVGRAVDDVLVLGFGEPRDRAAADLLDVKIALADVADAAAIGRELREHQRRGRGAGADLTQRAGCAIEHPVVAARVLAPDFFRVGVEQQPRAIRGPLVTVDRERRGRARRLQRRCRDEDGPGSGRRVVLDDVLGARRRG